MTSQNMSENLEQLGVFYLGRRVDPKTGEATDQPHLYQSRDLTTHGVCVGMTGSGKTGLSISLLEEAAIDGIPAIVIDPKGDMGNLMLSFPELKAKDFQPWIDSEEAARKGKTVEQYAGQMAETWRKGLEGSGQSGERIALFRNSVDVSIYTPGSKAGRPLAVLKSFAAPAKAVLDDEDLLQERIRGAVSGLLALLDIEADPIKSREFILLARILEDAWRKGVDLGLMDLIQQIQEPAFKKVGAFGIETFFPAKQRVSLAMLLNNLLVSPGFSVWLEGDPLDVQSLLFTAEGKPRLSIISIAHLSEQERMFIVTLLLNEVVSWMRSQPGTSSLRALLYMDEIFGFFPPTAMPPSKMPMLTLLKQARAFGLGVVLSTQNPVDLDYKGLSNTGTWFLGRLQTETDKERIMDGLESASAASGAGFDRREMGLILSGLGKRMFLQHNVHEEEPVLFKTRWALSFLRGPLTRTQIKQLMPASDDAPADEVKPKPETAKADVVAAEAQTAKPSIPAGVDQLYVLPDGMMPEWARLVYRPGFIASAKVHYVRASLGVDHWQDISLLTEPQRGAEAPDWSSAMQCAPELRKKPMSGAEFSAVPEAWQDSSSHSKWKKEFASSLYQERKLTVMTCKALGEKSAPGETERDFRARLAQESREKRDLEVSKIRGKYAAKLGSLEDKIVRANARIQRETEQYGHGKLDTAVAVGTALLGVFLGRGRSTGVTSTARAVRKASRARGQKGDIGRAQRDLELLKADVADIERQCELELASVRDKYSSEALEVETIELSPRKSDIAVNTFALAWLPWFVDESGIAERAWPQS